MSAGLTADLPEEWSLEAYGTTGKDRVVTELKGQPNLARLALAVGTRGEWEVEKHRHTAGHCCREGPGVHRKRAGPATGDGGARLEALPKTPVIRPRAPPFPVYRRP